MSRTDDLRSEVKKLRDEIIRIRSRIALRETLNAADRERILLLRHGIDECCAELGENVPDDSLEVVEQEP